MPSLRRHTVLCLAALILSLATGTVAQGKRPLAVDNLYDVRDVRDPQRSPDGKWVAYTVTRAIRETDKNDTDVKAQGSGLKLNLRPRNRGLCLSPGP